MKRRSMDRRFNWKTMKQIPRFSPDQLVLVLIVGIAVLVLALWRYFTAS